MSLAVSADEVETFPDPLLAGVPHPNTPAAEAELKNCPAPHVFAVMSEKSTPFDAAEIAVPFPLSTPVIEVEIVSAGVVPPEDDPANPFADATETAVR